MKRTIIHTAAILLLLIVAGAPFVTVAADSNESNVTIINSSNHTVTNLDSGGKCIIPQNTSQKENDTQTQIGITSTASGSVTDSNDESDTAAGTDPGSGNDTLPIEVVPAVGGTAALLIGLEVLR
jgi:hypothetical protein